MGSKSISGVTSTRAVGMVFRFVLFRFNLRCLVSVPGAYVFFWCDRPCLLPHLPHVHVHAPSDCSAYHPSSNDTCRAAPRPGPAPPFAAYGCPLNDNHYCPQVWNDEGALLGKFFLGMTSANMVFAGDGRLVILAETKVFVANIAAKAIPPVSP